MNRILLFLFLTTALPAFSQVNIKVKELIRNADSVILVSNQDDEPIATVIIEGEPLPPPVEHLQLVTLDNKLDYRAVVERRTLTAVEREQLIRIMSKLKPGADPGRKCIPLYRHAILIFNHGVPSWIQICFQCFQAEASENLSQSFGYDDRLLANLWRLFKSKGITYELPEEKHVKIFSKTGGIR